MFNYLKLKKELLVLMIFYLVVYNSTWKLYYDTFILRNLRYVILLFMLFVFIYSLLFKSSADQIYLIIFLSLVIIVNFF